MYIKREDAVKTVIRKCSPICAWQVGTQQYPDCVVAEINALPSADAVQEAVPTVVRVTMSDGSQYYLEHERDAIQADAVQGEWEHWGSPFSDESEVIDTIVCSVCGARFIEPKNEPKGEYNYCANCGAKMKGGAE